MGFGIKTRIVQWWHIVFRYRLESLRRRLLGDTSQHGEYLVMRKLLDDTVPPLLVDVGANNGIRHSNSYPFIQMGWSAVLIEPNPQVFLELQTLYRNNPKVTAVNCACGQRQGVLRLVLGKDGECGEYASLAEVSSTASSDVAFEVEVRRLTDVLLDSKCPAEIGILSVDTEGFDFQVFLGLDFTRFHPRIIITEDQSPDDAQKHDLLRIQGYQMKCRRGCNSIWKRDGQRPRGC